MNLEWITPALVLGGFIWTWRRIDNLSRDMNARIDTLSRDLNGRIDALGGDMNGRIDAVNQRLDTLLTPTKDPKPLE